jgi:hypothetical protein
VRSGSRRPWFNEPRGPKTKKEAITKLNTCGSAAAAGPQKPSAPVAASILTAIFHMLKNETVYQVLGADHLPPFQEHTNPAPGETP